MMWQRLDDRPFRNLLRSSPVVWIDDLPYLAPFSTSIHNLAVHGTQHGAL